MVWSQISHSIFFIYHEKIILIKRWSFNVENKNKKKSELTFKNSITWIHLKRNKTDSNWKTIQRVGTRFSEEKSYSHPNQKQTCTFKYNQIIQITAGLERSREKKVKEYSRSLHTQCLSKTGAGRAATPGPPPDLPSQEGAP